MMSMKLNLLIPILAAAISGQAAGPRSEYDIGRTYYKDGEFKKAAAHFQLALKTNPNDAECHYWTGMSYQVLADIASPLDSRYRSKARLHLTKAMELAPGRQDYRRELFDFLLDSAGSQPGALKQAAGILLSVSESDPDYRFMRWQFEREKTADSSVGTRLGRLFLVAPRAAYCIADLPASALSSR
jgi:tetratricopeptide (TPR) repeat protein